MNIASVGQQSYSVAVGEPSVAGNHCAHRRADGVPVSTVTDTGEPEPTGVEHHRHVRGKGHEHHGNGFGFGHYDKGLARFLRDQIHAARQEVTGEQIGKAVSELTAEVAGLFEAAGVQDDVAGAGERFSAALQEAVGGFDAGRIGMEDAMDAFQAAFGELVDALHGVVAADEPVTDAAVAAESEVVTAGIDPGAPESVNVTLVENLGQVFNAFIENLRADLAKSDGMNVLTSPENRTSLIEAIVALYREPVTSGDAGGVDSAAGVDLLA